MNISAITTKITNKSVNLLSDLANNSDSIMPMLVKDTMSNFAIVETYRKHGGKDDAKERAIEEFGTGAVWLLAIPGLKKLIDKTIYPKLKLNPDFDTRLILDENVKYQKPTSFLGKLFNDGVNKEAYKKIIETVKGTENEAYAGEKSILKSLEDKNIASLYKKTFFGKFLTATVASAIALVVIIKLKQKSTQKRIEKDFYSENASKILLNKKLLNDTKYQNFASKKQGKDVSFKGLGAFMTNPILNTLILDGVITSTRLAEARHGERKEVFLKEAFQIFFIYALAKPIQGFFEKAGNLFKLPIELDPKVLFSKGLKENLSSAVDDIKAMNAISAESLTEKIFHFAKENPASSLVKILDKNGTIPTIKDKLGNIKGMSVMSAVSEKELEKSLKHISSLSENVKNLGKIRGFKIFAVAANVLIAATAMGVLQPKVNIAVRKILNNGDNRNPAIVQKEKEMKAKLNLDK